MRRSNDAFIPSARGMDAPQGACRSIPGGNEARGAPVGACRNDGHTVDALALVAEEGRGHATQCPGEALAAGDPGVSEWGNPAGVIPRHPQQCGREPGELKHLSTPRKREDALSSGERTGQSPNLHGDTSLLALSWGGWTSVLEGAADPSRFKGAAQPNPAGTGGRSG